MSVTLLSNHWNSFRSRWPNSPWKYGRQNKSVKSLMLSSVKFITLVLSSLILSMEAEIFKSIFKLQIRKLVEDSYSLTLWMEIKHTSHPCYHILPLLLYQFLKNFLRWMTSSKSYSKIFHQQYSSFEWKISGQLFATARGKKLTLFSLRYYIQIIGYCC